MEHCVWILTNNYCVLPIDKCLLLGLFKHDTKRSSTATRIRELTYLWEKKFLTEKANFSKLNKGEKI